MSYYETVFICRQDISSTQVDTITDAMAELITNDGGKISRREYWGPQKHGLQDQEEQKRPLHSAQFRSTLHDRAGKWSV